MVGLFFFCVAVYVTLCNNLYYINGLLTLFVSGRKEKWEIFPTVPIFPYISHIFVNFPIFPSFLIFVFIFPTSNPREKESANPSTYMESTMMARKCSAVSRGYRSQSGLYRRRGDEVHSRLMWLVYNLSIALSFLYRKRTTNGTY